jgi:hypothetical protein
MAVPKKNKGKQADSEVEDLKDSTLENEVEVVSPSFAAVVEDSKSPDASPQKPPKDNGGVHYLINTTNFSHFKFETEELARHFVERLHSMGSILLASELKYDCFECDSDATEFVSNLRHMSTPRDMSSARATMHTDTSLASASGE